MNQMWNFPCFIHKGNANIICHGVLKGTIIFIALQNYVSYEFGTDGPNSF